MRGVDCADFSLQGGAGAAFLILADPSIEAVPPHDGTVDIALRVDPNTLRAAVVGSGSFRILDEIDRHAVAGAPDAEAFPPTWVIGPGLRVGHVHHVVFRDPDAA